MATGKQGLPVLNAMLLQTTLSLTRSISLSKQRTEPNLTTIEANVTDPNCLNFGLAGVCALFVDTLSDYSQPEGTEERLLNSFIDVAAQSNAEYIVLSVLPEGMPARAYIEKSKAIAYARQVAKNSNLKPIFVQV